jgi:hypothetical protein
MPTRPLPETWQNRIEIRHPIFAYVTLPLIWGCRNKPLRNFALHICGSPPMTTNQRLSVVGSVHRPRYSVSLSRQWPFALHYIGPFFRTTRDETVVRIKVIMMGYPKPESGPCPSHPRSEPNIRMGGFAGKVSAGSTGDITTGHMSGMAILHFTARFSKVICRKLY